MNTYFVTLRKGTCTEWTLVDATPLEAEEHRNIDIYRCPFEGLVSKVVLRFHAPSWEEARRVFDWKSTLDPKTPKKLYEWEEIRMLAEPQHEMAIHQE